MGILIETKEKQRIRVFKRYIRRKHKNNNYRLYKELLDDLNTYLQGGFHYLNPTSPLIKFIYLKII